MKKSYEYFLNKFCACELRNTHFILYGKITDVSELGVFLVTDQKASWLTWDSLISVIPVDKKVK